jgi:hypothetical protein
MTGEKKSFRRPLLVILNSFFAILILVFLFLKFYKVRVEFDGDFGTQPAPLLELMGKHFPGLPAKEIDVSFVFNSLPSASQVEAVEKLSQKVGSKATISAFFNSRFTIPFKISYPHHFSRQLVIQYLKNKSTYQGNFYVILRNKRVEYLDVNRNATNTAFMIMKKINPDLSYNDLVLAAPALKTRVVKRIKDGNLRLFSLEKDDYESIDSFLDKGISRIYFLHADCSSCQLKSLLSNIKLKQILDPGEILLIFSVMADRFELGRVLHEQKIDLRVLIDQNDEFGLFSVITDEKNNPLIIDAAEISGG